MSRLTGSGFAAPSLKLAAFGAGSAAGGWASQSLYPREIADVNGDGYPDIVGFGYAGVYVALNDKLGGFQSPLADIQQFGAGTDAGGWESQDLYPRLVADVSGDGHADIVGFAADGVYTSLFDDPGASTSLLFDDPEASRSPVDYYEGSTSPFDYLGASTSPVDYYGASTSLFGDHGGSKPLFDYNF